MNKLLKKFLYCEQVLNNYSLYNDNRYIFKMNLSNEYLPESQKFFKLPYFIIPIDRENNEFAQKYKDFLDVNFFINKSRREYIIFSIWINWWPLWWGVRIDWWWNCNLELSIKERSSSWRWSNRLLVKKQTYEQDMQRYCS